MWKATRSWRRVGVERAAHPLGGLVDLAVVVVHLAALEHEVLEEVGHPVLLRALGARAGVEGDEDRRGTRALQGDAVDGRPFGAVEEVIWGIAEDDSRRRATRPCTAAGSGTRAPRLTSLRPMATTHADTAARQARRGSARVDPGHPAVVIEFRAVAKRYAGGDAGARRRHRSRSAAASSCSSSARPARGKSTLMRLLIKELEPDAGTIRVAGRDLADDRPQQGPVLPAQPRRRLPGLQAAAQPHGARQRRLRAAGHRRHSRKEIRAKVPDILRLTGLSTKLHNFPDQLSGGEQQRVLGRARVRQPPAAAAGRRADRQPRPRDVDRDHAAAVPDQPHRHDGRRRHARPRDGRPHAPPRHRAQPGADRARRARRPYAPARR